MRPIIMLAVIAALGAPLAPIPAHAAEPTARVSGGNVSVYAGPGTRYGVIGKLAAGARVYLDYCTRNDRWCQVRGGGWVEGSYLVGWSAKIRVTQPEFASPLW
jgi:uncharacterized protein YraI